MKELPYLEAFVHVVELQSFSAAAKAMDLSKVSVSKQIAKLEEILGIRLLERTTRRVAPTDFGIQYFEQCKRILEEMREAISLASTLKEEPQGALKIVSATQFAKAYIIPRLKEFLARYPKLHLDLELAERIPDIAREKIDLLIGMSVSPSNEMIQKRIQTTRYAMCASPAYLKEWGVPKTPHDLVKHRYIAHAMRSAENRLDYRTAGGIDLSPYLRVNDAETMKQLALDGVGIVTLHEYLVRKELEEGSLVEILRPHLEDNIPIWLAYPMQRVAPRKTRVFIDFFCDKLPSAGKKER